MPPSAVRLKNLAIFSILFFFSFDLFSLYKDYLGLPAWTYLQYYSALAWSFLHGRLDVAGAPLSALDLSPYHGRVYAYFPPLTALLMMPIVAWRGPILFPQRLFAMSFGALNVGLFYLVCARLSRLLDVAARWPAIAVTLLFGFGTSLTLFSVVGNHWFVGQLTASTFTLIALGAGLNRDPTRRTRAALISAVAAAVAALGRQQLILSFPFWIYLALSDESFSLAELATHSPRALFRRPENWLRVFLVLIPFALVEGAMLAYNHARFGHWFDTGVSLQNIDLWQQRDIGRYGAFSARYFFRNVYYLLLRLPGFHKFDRQSWGMGFSVLAQCPFLFLLGYPTPPRFRALARGLAVVSALVMLPAFFFVSPGQNQFGARFFFDVMPFLTALLFLKLAVRRSWRPIDAVLALVSVGINVAAVVVYLPGPWPLP